MSPSIEGWVVILFLGLKIDKNLFFYFKFFNICCGYPLEVSQQGASNDYHTICFCVEMKEKNYTLYYYIIVLLCRLTDAGTEWFST